MAKEVRYLFLYELVYDKLYNHSNQSKEIDLHTSRKIVAHAHNIPKNIWCVVLKEMENMGWIEKINVDMIKLNKKPIKVLDNTTAVYKSVGLW